MSVDGFEDAGIGRMTSEGVEEADLERGVRIYRFAVRERTGLKHTGLPPVLRVDEDDRE